MGTIGSLVAGFIGWIISRFIKKKQEVDLQKKYANVVKNNIELSAENVALKREKEQRDLREKEKSEWEKASEDERTEILLRRYRNR